MAARGLPYLTAVVVACWGGPGFLLSRPLPLAAQEPGSLSTVQGRVVDQESGEALGDVAVSLASGPGGTPGIGTRVTNAGGRFLFRDVPAGTYRLVATLLGYRERRDTLEVEAGSDLRMVLPLTISPVVLDPIVVEAQRRVPGFMEDFRARRRTRPGTFMDREEIERRNALAFSDLFRMVPGARVVGVQPYGSMILLRGGCQPDLWIDGARTIDGTRSVDAILQPMDVEAVEVYHSSELPVEFGSSSCGGIVVWTRRGEPSSHGGSLWKRLVAAMAFLGLGFFLTR